MQTREEIIDKCTGSILNYIVVNKDGEDQGINASLYTMLVCQIDQILREIN